MASRAFAGDADINLPKLDDVSLGGHSSHAILFFGLLVCAIGAGLWPDGIFPDTRAAGAQQHAERLQYHLGDLQDLSLAAG